MDHSLLTRQPANEARQLPKYCIPDLVGRSYLLRTRKSKSNFVARPSHSISIHPASEDQVKKHNLPEGRSSIQ
jgi:hypothetical protein